jgi:hypothetical protein
MLFDVLDEKDNNWNITAALHGNLSMLSFRNSSHGLECVTGDSRAPGV